VWQESDSNLDWYSVPSWSVPEQQIIICYALLPRFVINLSVIIIWTAAYFAQTTCPVVLTIQATAFTSIRQTPSAVRHILTVPSTALPDWFPGHWYLFRSGCWNTISEILNRLIEEIVFRNNFSRCFYFYIYILCRYMFRLLSAIFKRKYTIIILLF
jgi:hypothetical protein